MFNIFGWIERNGSGEKAILQTPRNYQIFLTKVHSNRIRMKYDEIRNTIQLLQLSTIRLLCGIIAAWLFLFFILVSSSVCGYMYVKPNR